MANNKSQGSNKRNKRGNNQEQQQQQQSRSPGSTTSLGKRRRRAGAEQSQQQQQMSHTGEYGSQVTPFVRVPQASPGSGGAPGAKVAILGAAGGIGQPLALLLMMHVDYINHLALYDMVDSIHGVGLDVSHVDRQVRITTHQGPEGLSEAVRGARVIVVPAGLAQKPGQSRDDLFAANAEIMLQIAKTCAQVAPDAALAIITNPVNSLVPLACETYARLCTSTSGGAPKSPGALQQSQAKLADVSSASKQPEVAAKPEVAPKQPYHHLQFEDCFRRIFGVTTLDVVRASTLTAKSPLAADSQGNPPDPSKLQVPVVGGHAGKTIMPLLSQVQPKLDRKRLESERAQTQALVESIQQAGIEVLNAKKGRGSATLAMAYSAARFTLSLLRAQSGEQNVIECAYVRHPQPAHADLDYFATPLLLGRDGYVKSLGVPKTLMGYEQQMLEEGARELKLSIAKGEDFAREHLS